MGNALGTAQDAAALKQGGDAAVAKLKEDKLAMSRLKQMFGNDFEPTIGATDYYNKVQAQMGQVSQGAVAMTNAGSLQNQAGGAMITAQKQISTNAQVGATGNSAHAIASGISAGAGMVGGMSGDAVALNRLGAQAIENSAHVGAIEKTTSAVAHANNMAGQFGGRDLGGFTGSKADQAKIAGLESDLKKENDGYDNLTSTADRAKSFEKSKDLESQIKAEQNKKPLSLMDMMANNDNKQLTGQIGGAQSYQNMMGKAGSPEAGFAQLTEAARVEGLAGMMKSVANTGAMTEKWGSNLEKTVSGSTFTTEEANAKKILEAEQAKLGKDLKAAAKGTTITSGGGVAGKTRKEKADETIKSLQEESKSFNYSDQSDKAKAQRADWGKTQIGYFRKK